MNEEQDPNPNISLDQLLNPYFAKVKEDAVKNTGKFGGQKVRDPETEPSPIDINKQDLVDITQNDGEFPFQNQIKRLKASLLISSVHSTSTKSKSEESSLEPSNLTDGVEIPQSKGNDESEPKIMPSNPEKQVFRDIPLESDCFKDTDSFFSTDGTLNQIQNLLSIEEQKHEVVNQKRRINQKRRFNEKREDLPFNKHQRGLNGQVNQIESIREDSEQEKQNQVNKTRHNRIRYLIYHFRYMSHLPNCYSKLIQYGVFLSDLSPYLDLISKRRITSSEKLYLHFGGVLDNKTLEKSALKHKKLIGELKSALFKIKQKELQTFSARQQMRKVREN